MNKDQEGQENKPETQSESQSESEQSQNQEQQHRLSKSNKIRKPNLTLEARDEVGWAASPIVIPSSETHGDDKRGEENKEGRGGGGENQDVDTSGDNES